MTGNQSYSHLNNLLKSYYVSLMLVIFKWLLVWFMNNTWTVHDSRGHFLLSTHPRKNVRPGKIHCILQRFHIFVKRACIKVQLLIDQIWHRSWACRRRSRSQERLKDILEIIVKIFLQFKCFWSSVMTFLLPETVRFNWSQSMLLNHEIHKWVNIRAAAKQWIVLVLIRGEKCFALL